MSDVILNGRSSTAVPRAPCAHAVRRVARVGRVCATGAGSGRQGGPQAHAPVSPLADPASPVCMYVKPYARDGGGA